MNKPVLFHPYFWIVSIAAATGLAVRFCFVGEPLWIDELHTAWTVDAPISVDGFSRVVERAGQGNQTPLYFLFQWLICRSVGMEATGLRLLSLVSSIATIYIATRFVWRKTRCSIATTVTAALIVIDACFVFFATEARPYAFLQLVTTLQLLLFISLVDAANESKEIRANAGPIMAVLGLASFILPLIHLSAIFFLAGEMLCVATMFSHRAFKVFSIVIFAAGIGVAISFSTLQQVMNNHPNWNAMSNPHTLMRELSPLMAATVCGIAATIFSWTKRNNSDTKANDQTRVAVRQSLVILASCGIVPIATAIVGHFTGLLPIANTRYVFAGLIALPMFCGLSIGNITSRRSKMTFALIVGILALSLNPLIQHLTARSSAPVGFRFENWQSVVDRLEEQPIGNQPLIFLFANLVEDQLVELPMHGSFEKYLTFPLTGIYRLESDAAEIIPMTTRNDASIWRKEHLELVLNNEGAQIVARVRPDDFTRLLNSLHRAANNWNIQLKTSRERQEHNVLLIATIRVPNFKNQENTQR